MLNALCAVDIIPIASFLACCFPSRASAEKGKTCYKAPTWPTNHKAKTIGLSQSKVHLSNIPIITMRRVSFLCTFDQNTLLIFLTNNPILGRVIGWYFFDLRIFELCCPEWMGRVTFRPQADCLKKGYFSRTNRFIGWKISEILYSLGNALSWGVTTSTCGDGLYHFSYEEWYSCVVRKGSLRL